MMKITVAGLGINEVAQLTLEAVAALRQAEKILVLPITDDSRVAELESIAGKPVLNLRNLYREGAVDTDNYQTLVAAVVNAAKEYANVALVVPGHPRVGVSLVSWLEAEKDKQGFTLRVLPGISSFCTMINDLRFDPLERGTIMADANRVLLFESRIDPAFNLLLYHVCSVGTARVSRQDPLRNNQLGLLKAFLEKHYGPEHEVTLVSSSTEAGEPFAVRATIENLEACYPHVHYGTTLYVPAKSPRSLNRDFLSLLRNSAHEPAQALS